LTPLKVDLTEHEQLRYWSETATIMAAHPAPKA